MSDTDAPSRFTTRKRRERGQTPAEPLVWLTGMGLITAALMITGLLALVIVNGLGTFWPRDLVELKLRDGTKVLGEVLRTERYHVEDPSVFPEEVRRRIAAEAGWSTRRFLRVGNFDIYGEDFRWVPEGDIVQESRPTDAWLLERIEWGPAIGRIQAVIEDDRPASQPFGKLQAQAHDRWLKMRSLQDEGGGASEEIERLRLEARGIELRFGAGSPESRSEAAVFTRKQADATARYEEMQRQIESLRIEDARFRVVLRDVNGQPIGDRSAADAGALPLSRVVRGYRPNSLSIPGKLWVYLDRWREYLLDTPREANTEGGVRPAIFGTFMMTLILCVFVTPMGVIAALYLGEYAKQGWAVSAVRIAVVNLAGVPSIVYGVFGLGFFCYLVGGRIDSLFFPERLPAPTFGTGGILWASLTLALLTVPVVIVATEEALAAVPHSMREGSYACGASRWQTIRRIVLPQAAPGVLTGLILAVARGAGEVAPLMLTGVVKLAPAMPIDGHFPYVHLERSFMHLGFHIYDVGFQSRNSEAGKPMVFTTTLLLIAIVTLLNIGAMVLRARLRRRYATGHF